MTVMLAAIKSAFDGTSIGEFKTWLNRIVARRGIAGPSASALSRHTSGRSSSSGLHKCQLQRPSPTTAYEGCRFTGIPARIVASLRRQETYGWRFISIDLPAGAR